MATIVSSAGVNVIASTPAQVFGMQSQLSALDFERLMAMVVQEQAVAFNAGTATGDFAQQALARLEANLQGEVVGVPAGMNLSSTMEPGADLRDSGFSPGPSTALPAIIGVTALVRLLTPALATRALPVIRQTAAGGTIFWSRLPSWLQGAFGSAGAVVGLDLLMDLPDVFEVIPGGVIGGFGGGNGDHGVHLPHDLSAHIVGSWTANGVIFYRLSDGKLAVQNKRGRWKVWRPKKPIVIMPTGAVDLRTMLRADAVLNKQAKRLAAMLNRRAPRPRRSKTPAISDSVIVVDGKAVKT